MKFDLDFIRKQQVVAFMTLLASTEKLGNKKQAYILEEYTHYLHGEIQIVDMMVENLRNTNSRSKLSKKSKKLTSPSRRN